MHFCLSAVQNAVNCKHHAGQHEGRHRGDQHIADVLEKRRPRRGGSKHRGIRERGNLIPKICAADYGSGSPAWREIQGGAYADKGHAYGGDGGPGTARKDGNKGADYRYCKEENPW